MLPLLVLSVTLPFELGAIFWLRLSPLLEDIETLPEDTIVLRLRIPVLLLETVIAPLLAVAFKTAVFVEIALPELPTFPLVDDRVIPLVVSAVCNVPLPAPPPTILVPALMVMAPVELIAEPLCASVTPPAVLLTATTPPLAPIATTGPTVFAPGDEFVAASVKFVLEFNSLTVTLPADPLVPLVVIPESTSTVELVEPDLFARRLTLAPFALPAVLICPVTWIFPFETALSSRVTAPPLPALACVLMPPVTVIPLPPVRVTVPPLLLELVLIAPVAVAADVLALLTVIVPPRLVKVPTAMTPFPVIANVVPAPPAVRLPSAEGFPIAPVLSVMVRLPADVIV